MLNSTIETKGSLPKLPNRQHLLSMISETATTEDLIKVFKDRYALKRQIKEDQAGKRMVGRSNYKLPDVQRIKKNFNAQNELQQKIFIENVSKNALNEEHMQGMIYVNDYKVSQHNKQLSKGDPVQDYVKNFSELQDIFEQSEEQPNVYNFAKALQEKVQVNQVKVGFKNALFGKMKNFKINRDLDDGFITAEEAKKALQPPEQNMFNKCVEEETKTISNIANTFVRQTEYAKTFKKRELSVDKHGIAYDQDPRITYFKKCLQKPDLVLPILDKIYKKTLCLNDYLLSDGNCRGLAAACELFDHQVVNRVLFNNCGLTGD